MFKAIGAISTAIEQTVHGTLAVGKEAGGELGGAVTEGCGALHDLMKLGRKETTALLTERQLADELLLKSKSKEKRAAKKKAA